MNLILNLFMKLFVPAAEAYERVGFWEAMKPPLDISTNGHLIDSLFLLTTWLIIFFFFFVCLGIFGFSFLYNKKRHPKALYSHGTSRKQLALVAGIGALVFIMVDMQITTISNHDYVNSFINYPKANEKQVQVEVLAQQWAWNFRYAGKDGIFNTEDDIVTLNDLRVPVNTKIIFQITAKDVIHAFYVPNARIKVDAMPGRISRLWFELTKPGVYDIACAEMCGTFHYRMQAKLTVLPQAEYDAWLSEMQERAPHVIEQDKADLFWGWQWNPTTIGSN
jgi:cytochrome c oxidase subunit 2